MLAISLHIDHILVVKYVWFNVKPLEKWEYLLY